MSTDIQISAKHVKELRDRTGAGMMDCKQALTETGGDVEKAVELLRVKLGDKALKIGGREATEGTVQSYIHANGKVGVLVEVDCNTDFVARNDDFIAFARDVALHIAASPTTQYVSEDEIPEDAKAGRAARLRAAGGRQARERARRRSPRASCASGWRRSSSSTRRTSTPTSTTARRSSSSAPSCPATTGENVVIRRFARFAVGAVGSAPNGPVFKRILLKLSGEALMGALDYGTDPERVRPIAQQIKTVHDRGVEIAIVLGAGNIYRGLAGAAAGMDRATADYMGMLATVLNALHAAGRAGEPRACTRACSRAITSPRSPSPTSAAARCATSRRAAS